MNGELSPNSVIGNYEIISKLGSGSFATVWLARNITTGLNVAIKVINKETINSQEALNRFARELSLLKRMDHPFIAELFDIIETPDSYNLVIEYVEHGNMLDFVNNNGRLSEDKARRYFCQLISALDYLHNQKFVAHRDLKAENVLLDRYDNIRLIDFGLSNEFNRKMPQLKTACGSPAYAAPEMIQGCPYTKACDMWSAGILLFAMVAGHLPFDDKNVQVLLHKVVFNEVQFPATMSRSLVDLLKRLLTKNPDSRITMNRLKEHPWFSQSEYRSIMEFNFHDSRSWLVNDTESADNIVDRDILDKMASLNVDIKDLAQSIILGEYIPSTAIYRQLRKDKITEQMKDMMANMQRLTSSRLGQMMGQPDMLRYGKKQSLGDIEILPPASVLARPNFGSVHGQVTTKVFARRMSRPIAVRRTVIPTNQDEHRVTSLETPI
ncbi:CAMK family protein kinase [Tritrichomonas foetus]|uniref:non-specific serine/threonine protein kinase n=1 Tax=Tritrichomonas foetus TaxID=1144522 RepID=A0A1J4KM15_9EUKA|nr:CAMK family protein kinase [Tritrichomonas foetus]|eukprot:OHT10734.1 CAMK family protein kinase [Tritrichomonas foetus]